jgi:hypothetical protein
MQNVTELGFETTKVNFIWLKAGHTEQVIGIFYLLFDSIFAYVLSAKKTVSEL